MKQPCHYDIVRGTVASFRTDGNYNAGKPRTTRLDRAWALQQREQAKAARHPRRTK